jgi:uncharacterized protein
MKVTKSEIINYLKANKSEFENKYFIDRFGLFGSYARGEAGEYSDIDISYILKEGKKLSYFELFNLEKKLEKYFDRRVDLINYRYMNPIVKYKSSKEIIYV